ncbi:QcrA and Rieske domain-containing protein [Jiulongibacter sp. NS-SX5]|uniref:QcrA and Rieske domain-containing protein n=1 Tax=Jiulongibacter sp. NS-SX5 TaxID=3463854 RepID=UPI004059E12D
MIKEDISRAKFIKQLGLSSKALMAFYCLGGLSACTTEDTPEPNTNTNNNQNQGTNQDNEDSGIEGTTTGASIDFTLDLTHSDFSKLKTAGEFVYVSDIIIANSSSGMVALSKKCTHQGTTIEFRSGTNDFLCPNHQSQFALDGSVTKSPAANPLKVYTTSLSEDGNLLQVKS